MSDDMHDLLGAYLLGALSESEHDDFVEHLTACIDCQAELDQMLPGLAGLMELDNAGELSDDLVARLTDHDRLVDREPVVERRAPVRNARISRSLLALAAGVLVLALGVGGLLALRQQTDLVGEIAAADDAESLALANETSGGVVLVRSVSEGGVAFQAQDLAPLEDGESYVLWELLPGDEVVYIGPIEDDDGQDVSQAWTGDVGKASGFALSIESGSGIPAAPSERITYLGLFE